MLLLRSGVGSGAVRERSSILLLHGSGRGVEQSGVLLEQISFLLLLRSGVGSVAEQLWSGVVSCCSHGVKQSGSRSVSCCSMEVRERIYCINILLRSQTTPLCSQFYFAGSARYCFAPKVFRSKSAPLPLSWSSKILLGSLTAPLPTPLCGSSKILLQSKSAPFHTTPPRSHSHGAEIYCSASKLIQSKLLLLQIPALKIQIKFIS